MSKTENWVDSTAVFQKAREEMTPGQLITGPTFDLRAAVFALESNAPKMDVYSGDIKTVSMLLKEAGVNDVNDISAEVAAATIDLFLTSIHGWMENCATIPQSFLGVTLFKELKTLSTATGKVSKILYASLMSLANFVLTVNEYINVAGVAYQNEDYMSLDAAKLALPAMPTAELVTPLMRDAAESSALVSESLHLRVEAVWQMLNAAKAVTVLLAQAVIPEFELTALSSLPAGQLSEQWLSEQTDAVRASVAKKGFPLKELLAEVGKHLQAATQALNKLSEQASKADNYLETEEYKGLFSFRLSCEPTVHGPPKFCPLLAPGKAAAALGKGLTALRTTLPELLASTVSYDTFTAAQKRRVRAKQSLFVRSACQVVLVYILESYNVQVEEIRTAALREQYLKAADAHKTLRDAPSPAAATGGKKGKKGGDDLKFFEMREKAQADVIAKETALLQDAVGASVPRSIFRLVIDHMITHFGWNKDLVNIHSATPAALLAALGYPPAVIEAAAAASTIEELSTVAVDNADLAAAANTLTELKEAVRELAALMADLMRIRHLTPSRAHRSFNFNNGLANGAGAFLSKAMSVLSFAVSVDRQLGVTNPSHMQSPSLNLFVKDLVFEGALPHIVSGFEMGIYELQDVSIISWAVTELVNHRVSNHRASLARQHGHHLPDTAHQLAHMAVNQLFQALQMIATFLAPMLFRKEHMAQQMHNRFVLRLHGFLYKWPALKWKGYTESHLDLLEGHVALLQGANNELVELKQRLDANPAIVEAITKVDPLGMGEAQGLNKVIIGNRLFIARLDKKLQEFEESNTEEDFFTWAGINESKIRLSFKNHAVIPTFELDF